MTEDNYTNPDLNAIDSVLHLTDTGFITFKIGVDTVASIVTTANPIQKMIRTSIGWRYTLQSEDELLRLKYKQLVVKQLTN